MLLAVRYPFILELSFLCLAGLPTPEVAPSAESLVLGAVVDLGTGVALVAGVGVADAVLLSEDDLGCACAVAADLGCACAVSAGCADCSVASADDLAELGCACAVAAVEESSPSSLCSCGTNNCYLVTSNLL